MESWPSPSPWLYRMSLSKHCVPSLCLSFPLCSVELPSMVASQLRSGNWIHHPSLFSFLPPRMPVGVTPAPLRRNPPLTLAMNPTGPSSALCGLSPGPQSPAEVGWAGALGVGETRFPSVVMALLPQLGWPSGPWRVGGCSAVPSPGPGWPACASLLFCWAPSLALGIPV